MATFILIHGGWHGAWCWHKVAPLLKKKGHTVIAPDLPGHGIDRTPPGDVTLQHYVGRVCEILDASPEPVVLVGHSLGGFVITQVAELRPKKVKHLVYLSAVLIGNGALLSDFVQTVIMSDFVQRGDSRMHATGDSPGGIVMADDQCSMTLRLDIIRDTFYADCSDADVTLAEMLLTPQPLLPFQAAQHTTPENWGRIPRHFIECLQDHSIPLEVQRHCQQQLPCKTVVSMNTSHSPFFSAPGELVAHLVGL